jgi:tetratricopeptide (TPR) repeat protein
MPGSATSSISVVVAAVVLSFAAAPAAAQPSGRGGEDDSAAFVDEGRAALRKRDYHAAARALDEALRLNPRRLEAYVLRTAVYSAAGDHAAGVALMERAAALAPDDTDVLTALGTQLVLAGRAADGVPLLQRVVTREPARYDAQLVLGEHWHATGAWPEAITALEAYLAARPRELAGEDADHQVELADSYLRSRQPRRALALFETAAAARPDALRIRIGVAWATAAIDCRRARPLLAELAASAEQVPDIWLVDGQCALALGDPAAALALGRRYLARADRAAGHALVGDAEAARGDLPAARAALARARELEPDRRRWAVRLAYVLRLAGEPRAAIAELDAIGPPARAAVEPAWWAELADALIASGDAAGAVARLRPIAGELGAPASTDTGAKPAAGADTGAKPATGSKPAASAGADTGAKPAAGALTAYGHALAVTGDTAAAAAVLATADAAESTPRSRIWLAYALHDTGMHAFAGGDAAGAERALARAAAVAPNAWAIQRNLGMVRLATGGDAIGPLEIAVGDGDPASWALLGRARAAAKDADGARIAFDKALDGARGALLVEIAIDAAASELAAAQPAPATAVAALERAAPAARSADAALAARHRAALATARHAAGLAALRAGQAAKAVEYLAAAAGAHGGGGGDDYRIKCDLAVASVVGAERDVALRRLRAVAAKPCPFPAPADVQAVPILIAFVEGRQERKAQKALARLQAIDAKTSGPIDALIATAIRVVALEAADAAYRGGKLAQARKLLAEAKRVQTRAGADELAHNLAVIDLADGKTAAAVAALERSKLPEALVNLGVAHDRAGEPTKALDAWRRARRAGVRFAPLADWITAKEQIYGEADR